GDVALAPAPLPDPARSPPRDEDHRPADPSAQGRVARLPEELTGSAALRPGRAKQTVHAVDRKSTRLNSSHGSISYAVLCLKQKKMPTVRLTAAGTLAPSRPAMSPPSSGISPWRHGAARARNRRCGSVLSKRVNRAGCTYAV